jgi:cytochrome b561
MNTHIVTGNRYHALLVGSHWLTLILLIAVYALIDLHGAFPKGSDAREAMKTWHFMLGMTVFGLVFVRLTLRSVFRSPPIEPAPAAWQQSLATAMHVALYAFLIVMPLLGWLALSAKGVAVPFFGFELPALIAPDRALGKRLEDIHEAIGNVGYYLIGLHALAALSHHYFMHDDTLRRMSPWRDRASASAEPRRLR